MKTCEERGECRDSAEAKTLAMTRPAIAVAMCLAPPLLSPLPATVPRSGALPGGTLPIEGLDRHATRRFSATRSAGGAPPLFIASK